MRGGKLVGRVGSQCNIRGLVTGRVVQTRLGWAGRIVVFAAALGLDVGSLSYVPRPALSAMLTVGAMSQNGAHSGSHAYRADSAELR